MRWVVIFVWLLSLSFGKDVAFVVYAPVPPELSGLYKYIDASVRELKKWAQVVEVRTYGDLVDRMLSLRREDVDSVSVFVLGHSNGISLLPDVDAESFSLPYRVDLLVLDVCYVGTVNRILRLSQSAKRIVATDWEVPQWGMDPLYRFPDTPRVSVETLMKRLGEFYGEKMRKKMEAFRKANVPELKFYGYDGKTFYTLFVRSKGSEVRVSLFGEKRLPEKGRNTFLGRPPFPSGHTLKAKPKEEVLWYGKDGRRLFSGVLH